MVVFDCTCNTQYSLLLNQHNGDDAPQDDIRYFNMLTLKAKFSLRAKLRFQMNDLQLEDILGLSSVWELACLVPAAFSLRC